MAKSDDLIRNDPDLLPHMQATATSGARRFAWMMTFVLALVLQTIETGFGVANLYFYRTLPVAVPGAAFNACILAVLVLATALAVRTQNIR